MTATALCLLSGLAAAAETRPAQAPPADYYMAVLVNGKKIGYTRITRQHADGKVVTTVQIVTTVQRMGEPMTTEQREKHIETPAGEPLGFEVAQNIGNGAVMTAVGTVKDGKAAVEIKTDKLTRQVEIDFPQGALMAEGMRLLLLKKGFVRGTTFDAKMFMPLMLKALDARVTMGPVKAVDLLGRVVDLAEATLVVSGETGEMRATMYLSPDGDGLKEVKTQAGMEIVLIQCPKQYAMMPGESLDIVELTLVKSPAALGDLRQARGATYRIVPTEETIRQKGRVELLRSPSQTVSADGDALVVTVTPVAAEGGEFPYRGTDPEALAALKPNAYLQSDANEVRELAAKAVAGAKDAASAARKIEAFVHGFVRAKDLSVGYATALEVARSGQGDCSECAVLAAAMCRAAGLPAQVVTGVTYVERFRDKRNVFCPHAWFRVWIDGKWVDFDAALPGFDAGHIAIVAGDGDPNDFGYLVSALGCFRIADAKKR